MRFFTKSANMPMEISVLLARPQRVSTGLTDKYPSHTIRNADGGDLERLELETLHLIVNRSCFGVEGLGDQPHIVDPWVPVDQLSIDSSKLEGFTHNTHAGHWNSSTLAL